MPATHFWLLRARGFAPKAAQFTTKWQQMSVASK